MRADMQFDFDTASESLDQDPKSQDLHRLRQYNITYILLDCDATFFVLHASSDKQRYVPLIYSMRPAPKSNGTYAVINTPHVIGLS